MLVMKSILIALTGWLLATNAAFAEVKPTAAKSGAAMCVLAPDDFKAVGIANASKPTANVSDGGAGAYCVYAGKSSATGGLELDVFHPAGASDADVKETERTAIGEGGVGKPEDIKLAGADSARWARARSGGPEFAALVVRRAKLVFVLGIPADKDAKDRLTKLGALVLARLAK
jgi:hypothetical protein